MQRVFLVLTGTSVRRIAALLNPKLNGIKSIFSSDEDIAREGITASATADGIIDFMHIKPSEYLTTADLCSVESAGTLILTSATPENFVENLIIVVNEDCHKALPGYLQGITGFKNLSEEKCLSNHPDHIVIIDFHKKTIDYLGAGKKVAEKNPTATINGEVTANDIVTEPVPATC